MTCPAGWKLSGWSEASTGETRTLIKDNDKIESDKTLYGVFVEDTQTFKIPVFAGKFTFSNDTKIITGETTQKTGTISNLLGSTTLKDDNDYVVKGWSDGTTTYSSTDTIDFTTVKALYAVETPKIRSVKVEDKTGQTHVVGDVFKLTPTIDSISELESASKKWSSSNETVATVDENGNVTCLEKGNTVIKLEVWTPWQTSQYGEFTVELTVSLKNCCCVNFTEAGTITQVNAGTNVDTPPTIEYSTDKGNTWNTLTTSATSFPAGQNVYLRGNNPSGISTSKANYSKITIADGKCTLSGTIMSLLYGESPTDEQLLTIPCDYCFYILFDAAKITSVPENFLPATTLTYGCYKSLFNFCTILTNAPKLPATKLEPWCYEALFYNCWALKEAPELPATILANYCYQSMFQTCTSLTTAPALPATKYWAYNSTTKKYDTETEGLASYCYQSMFIECSKLTTLTIPEGQDYYLPATEMGSYCYANMFKKCTSLVTAPKLPATTLDWHCYSAMFQECTSLTTLPPAVEGGSDFLPASKLDSYCYQYMFYGCTALETPPTLPATTLNQFCYYHMFEGCSKLATAPELPATGSKNNCYDNMFVDCTSLKVAPTINLTYPGQYACSTMFKGCTSLTTAPASLPSHYGYGCYYRMFYGCTSLTTAPTMTLPSASGSYYNEVYQEMFYGCTSLKVYRTTSSTIPSGGTLIFTLDKSIGSTGSATNVFTDMFTDCSSSGTFTGTPAFSTSYTYKFYYK